MQITKIIEGVVDLETGEQHSMGVMVKTRRGESFLPLNSESIQRLVELWAQTQMADFEVEKMPVEEEEPELEEQEEANYSSVFDEDMFGEAFQEPRKPQKKQPVSSIFPSLMDEESQVEFEPDPEEPGEVDEYSDPFTGTASI